MDKKYTKVAPIVIKIDFSSDTHTVVINNPKHRPIGLVTRINGRKKYKNTGHRGVLHSFKSISDDKGRVGTYAVLTFKNRYENVPCDLLMITDKAGVIPKEYRNIFKEYKTKHKFKKGEFEVDVQFVGLDLEMDYEN